MPYIRKTVDVWDVYISDGYGWELKHAGLTRSEMQVNRKAYRENCRYPVRIVKHRERIEEKAA